MDVAVIANEIKRGDLLDMYYYLRLTRSLEDRISALYRQGLYESWDGGDRRRLCLGAEAG